jgi:hypothetical protein
MHLVAPMFQSLFQPLPLPPPPTIPVQLFRTLPRKPGQNMLSVIYLSRGTGLFSLIKAPLRFPPTHSLQHTSFFPGYPPGLQPTTKRFLNIGFMAARYPPPSQTTDGLRRLTTVP